MKCKLVNLWNFPLKLILKIEAAYNKLNVDEVTEHREFMTLDRAISADNLKI